MTNGAGSHGHKREKKGASKQVKGKAPKAALKRKGWLPTGAAKDRNA